MNLTLPLPALQKARFIDRPNRFLVRCRLETGETVTAFLPNPGRLWELFFPAAELWVTHGEAGERKTEYTVVAVERGGSPIFLHTHLSNLVARKLLEQRSIPELAEARVIRAEYPVGNSRFDFQLQQGHRQIYLESALPICIGNLPTRWTCPRFTVYSSGIACDNQTERPSVDSSTSPRIAGC